MSTFSLPEHLSQEIAFWGDPSQHGSLSASAKANAPEHLFNLKLALLAL